MTKPNLIHVVQHLHSGGIETLVLEMLRLSTQPCLIVSLEGDKQAALANWPRLIPYEKQLVFFTKAPGVHISLVAELQRFFTAIKPDVVHTHHIGPLLYAGLAAKMAGVPVRIHTEHDIWHLDKNKQRWLQKMLLGLVKPHLVADAPSLATRLQAYFPRHSVTTIVNGIDTQHFIPGSQQAARASLTLPQDCVLIGCAGRLEQVKGQDRLIAAMPALPSHVHLAIAGEGSKDQALKQQVKALALQQRVHFLGHIRNMVIFYQALDLFCLPSRNEGYPLSALEAQACGIATAVTDVGSAKQTLCPITGRVIDGDNIKAMAQGLEQMLNATLNVSPRHFIAQHNDIRTMLAHYQALHGAG